MQPAFRYLSAAALALVSVSSFADTTVYTSSADFQSHVVGASYTETFTNMADPSGSASFSGAGFAYTASSSSDLYLSAGYLSTNFPNFALTLTFTSGNVNAISGNFYLTNFSDAFQSASVKLTLSDSTTITFTPATLGDSFRGFVSTTPITSLTFSAPVGSMYAGIDNLTVGVGVVPEPASWLLMALGGSALLVAARKRNHA